MKNLKMYMIGRFQTMERKGSSNEELCIDEETISQLEVELDLD